MLEASLRRSLYRLGFAFIALSALGLFQISCKKVYVVSPLPAPTPTGTPCVDGLGHTCTPTFTATPSSTATVTPTSTPTSSPTPTFSRTPSPTVTNTGTATPTGTPTSSATMTATATPTDTQTPVPTNAGVVSTLAGTGSTGSANGPGITASFTYPTGIAVDGSGNIYVADEGDDLIRKITPGGGLVTTLAGQAGVAGAANGMGTTATFNSPWGVAVDSSGNVYVADEGNNMIREITPAGQVSTLAGSGYSGSANGTGTGSSFDAPTGVAVDSSGNVYVADEGNDLIRKITSGGVVSTLAGQAGVAGATNGTGTAASFNNPFGIAVNPASEISFVGDTGNELTRETTSGGVVSTLAGQAGAAGATNGTGTAASFNNPTGIALDSSGNVYVADEKNNLIREITSGGVVSTLAGQAGVTGTANGSGTMASFDNPYGVAVDGSGNVYVADTINNLIREIQ